MNHSAVISCLALSFFTLLSCKKESFEPTVLEGDLAFLVGEWEWQYTIHDYDNCNEFINEIDTLTPQNINETYGLEFLEEGILKFYRNDAVFTEKRIEIVGIEPGELPVTFSAFSLNNMDIGWSGIWSDPILDIGGYPYPHTKCNYFSNYYIKKE